MKIKFKEGTKVTIRKDGTIVGILDEKFDTTNLGKREVKRLSQVSWIDYQQGWMIFDETTQKWLDKVFTSRADAILYERWYMSQHFKRVLKFAGVK